MDSIHHECSFIVPPHFLNQSSLPFIQTGSHEPYYIPAHSIVSHWEQVLDDKTSLYPSARYVEEPSQRKARCTLIQAGSLISSLTK
jgi:hypothetical protein